MLYMTIVKSLLVGVILSLVLGCATNMDRASSHVGESGRMAGDNGESGLSRDQEDMLNAAWNGQLVEVERLLKDGIDPNSLGEFGVTALSLATQNNQGRVVLSLLEHGADPNMQDHKAGWFPLMWAAYNGNSKLVKLLIEHGADIDMRNTFGETAMIHAAFEGHDDTVRLLLDQGADFTLKNDRGFDALRAARNKGWYRITQMLVEAGADKDGAVTKTPAGSDVEVRRSTSS